MLMQCLRLFLLALIVYTYPASASIDTDLDNFFNNLGFSTNVTQSEIYQGQNAGYYTGGSLYARNRVRDIQLAEIQLPNYRAGCGGIDLFLGGFSFINSEDLIAALKNVANNAASYAFMLAIDTVSPLIAKQMENLQNLANQVNQTNINSCETAESLVGALWPKTDLAQKEICSAVGTSKGLFSDWAQARQQCGTGGARNTTLTDGKNDIQFKELILHNTNIAWRALQKNAFLSQDTELAELFMSISGSIIIKQQTNDDKAVNQIIPLPSLATQPDLIQTLLYGKANATFYKCDETKECLSPQKLTFTIDSKHGLANRIKSLLESMLNKVQRDEALSNEEIGLLQATHLPLYKMLNVNVAYARGKTAPMEITTYSEVIASDILYQYLMEALDVVLVSSNTLQFPLAIMKQFQQGIISARATITELRNKTLQDVNTTFEMIQKTQLIEQQLTDSLSADLINSINWANGIHSL